MAVSAALVAGCGGSAAAPEPAAAPVDSPQPAEAASAPDADLDGTSLPEPEDSTDTAGELPAAGEDPLRPGQLFTLRGGDIAAVAGTTILCSVGEAAVVCGQFTEDGAQLGPVAVIGGAGVAVLDSSSPPEVQALFRANHGSPSSQPPVQGTEPQLLTLNPGDAAIVEGTAILCVATSGNFVGCELRDDDGAQVPGNYAVGVSPEGISVVRVSGSGDLEEVFRASAEVREGA